MDDSTEDLLQAAFRRGQATGTPADDDCLLLAHYLDNTLQPEARAQLEERIAHEPELLYALARIYRDTSSALAEREEPNLTDSHLAQEIIPMTFTENPANADNANCDSAVQDAGTQEDTATDKKQAGGTSQ